jgi:autotransporter-associated beta strand protein
MAAAHGAQTATWQQRAAGTYSWGDAANWNPAVPNAAGAVANLNAGLQGNLNIVLNGEITIGALSAGDKDGIAGSSTTISRGTGGKPLTFEGATAGAGTALNFALGAPPPSGNALDLASGIRLGGASPLTVTINSTARFDCAIGVLDLNGNTFTLTGPPRIIDGNINTGIMWQVSSIMGKGSYVQNGAGTHLLNTCPDFTGALIVNHGWFVAETAGLPNASQYVIAGASTNHKKYPCGGRFQLGSHYPPVATLPDRLSHEGTLVFKGGFFEYAGQGLAPQLQDKAVVEQVRQIQFLSGMSQIRLRNGNDVSSSTTLLANDPASGLVRQPGATLMIGGDDSRSAKGFTGALGVGEKFIIASGMAGFLKGGGGAAGSKSVSIIPWITLGTYYHPGQGKFVTYDSDKGIRCLTDAEYFTGAVLGCPPDSNFFGDNLNLGANHTQTINSFATESWKNTDIGPGSTLTISSGVIRWGSGPGSIGDGEPANAGTINFGPAEGIIWTGFDTPYGPNTIGSVLTGTGGLTTAGNNVLVLKAANTYTGKTCVGSGILQVGDGKLTNSKLGNGDVEVAAGGTLCIKAKVVNAIADTATVTLGNTGEVFFGRLELESGVNETVAGLLLGDAAQPAGTYGSKDSAATHKLDNYFSGPGVLTVSLVSRPKGQ